MRSGSAAEIHSSPSIIEVILCWKGIGGGDAPAAPIRPAGYLIAFGRCRAQRPRQVYSVGGLGIERASTNPLQFRRTTQVSTQIFENVSV